MAIVAGIPSRWNARRAACNRDFSCAMEFTNQCFAVDSGFLVNEFGLYFIFSVRNIIFLPVKACAKKIRDVTH